MEQELTKSEEQQLRHFIFTMKEGEKNQILELFTANISRHRIAATYDAYVRDWERTKARMETNLQSNTYPPNTSRAMYLAVLKGAEEVMDYKLQLVQMMFESNFKESIFNFLGKDGKKKRLFGIF